MAAMTDGPGPGRVRSGNGPGIGRHDRPGNWQGNAAGLAQAFGGRNLGRMTHFAGAAVSLALIAGVSVWGYRLIMRDVNGIPVVQAMEGPMRVAPDDPGGEVAAHTGLAVNAIAAVGEAAPPEDMLLLAPATAALTDEDMEVAFAAESAVAAAPDRDADAAENSAGPQTLSAEQVLALADQIAAGADPLSDLAPGETAAAMLSVEGQAVSAEAQFTVIPADVPGVSVSLRPVLRPAMAADVAAAVASAMPASAEAAPPPLVTESLPPGTDLVQLGAYATPEIAALEWDRIAGRFGELLAGKTRVIQEASSGGVAFFRLRATGFADGSDARRFCSALLAEGAECVSTRE